MIYYFCHKVLYAVKIKIPIKYLSNFVEGNLIYPRMVLALYWLDC